MSARLRTTATLAALATMTVVAFAARADETPPETAPADSAVTEAVEPAAPIRVNGLEPLHPELAAHPYRLEPGRRPFQHRFAVSPGFGFLGSERLFVMALDYNPDGWLGYEAAVGHNPGQAVHAVIHSFTAMVRHPFPGRLQPYACAGYGMVLVFPGQSVNADPVTKNALTFGGGLEFYVRSDLALRGDVRRSTVFGQTRDRDGVVAYDYLQGTVGLSFYRSVRP